jgi:hypothetical protein
MAHSSRSSVPSSLVSVSAVSHPKCPLVAANGRAGGFLPGRGRDDKNIGDKEMTAVGVVGRPRAPPGSSIAGSIFLCCLVSFHRFAPHRSA